MIRMTTAKIRTLYSINADNLNEKAQKVLPGNIGDITGTVWAFSDKQAVCIKLKDYEPFEASTSDECKPVDDTDSERSEYRDFMWKISHLMKQFTGWLGSYFSSGEELDEPEKKRPDTYEILRECLKPESELYSPDFVKPVGGRPLKANLIPVIREYIIEKELGSFRGSLKERKDISDNFMTKYDIYDSKSGNIELLEHPTKTLLNDALNGRLNKESYGNLNKIYLTLLRLDPDAPIPDGLLGERQRVVQGTLF